MIERGLLTLRGCPGVAQLTNGDFRFRRMERIPLALTSSEVSPTVAGARQMASSSPAHTRAVRALEQTLTLLGGCRYG